MARTYALPPAEEICGYLLEVFELGVGPLDSGQRHTVWLHLMRSGDYRWRCSCGAHARRPELDAALLAEARGHFDRPWSPRVVGVWHPLAIWTDRATGADAPSEGELADLARELAEEMHAGSGLGFRRGPGGRRRRAEA